MADDGDQIPVWMRYKAEAESLRAERDRYMAEASERQQTIGRIEAERDALAAQVAALAEECGANPNDIPAAAARYLAAERVAEACAVANDYSRSSGDRQRAYDDGIEALAMWREAAGR